MRVWCCGLVVGAGVLLGACAGGGSGTGQVVPATTTKAPKTVATGPLKTSSPPETPVTTTTRLTPETTRATTHRTTTAQRPTTPRRTATRRR